ncbi:F-box only protein 24-like [Engraulis encrasicolus]|uniref:F-box only protein 24-like n=1 Tax=Engraulis encrasicolus TaxID=184585 RepID=UPI002FD06189
MAERPKRGKMRTNSGSEAPSTAKKRKTGIAGQSQEQSVEQFEEYPSISIDSLPPELVEEILSWVSARDVISFGATCTAFYQLSLSSILWKNLYQHKASGRLPVTDGSGAGNSVNWKRMAIFKYTQSLYLQRLSGGGANRGSFSWNRSGGGQLVSRAVVPPTALGFLRAQPTRDHLLLWDQQRTLFMLRNGVMTTQRGQLAWRRAARYSVLCHNAKDFAVDPRPDVSHRGYVYVLVNRMDSLPAPNAAAGPSGAIVPMPPPPQAQRCDCVEVYQQDNGLRVFRMTFHFSLTFTQIRLTGSEFNRTLLLLTDTGKVYALYVNESQLSMPRSYTVQLALKKISSSLPNVPIRHLQTGYNSVVYLTNEGGVYIEVHAAGVYRQLFGSNAGFDPHDVHAPLPLSIPNKVVKCSVGQTHLCLVDESGRLYMQGCNRYGQLGTGDKIDRGEPTMVALSLALVDVFCGLNHSLALLQEEGGSREVHGCGCGAGGRLPGCPDGSAVFIKLRVRVSRSTRSICASKDCLYLLSSHDIEEPPITCPPSAAQQEQEEAMDQEGGGGRGREGHNKALPETPEERERLRSNLSLLQDCGNMQEQLDMLQDTIQTHMTLSSTHRDFLDQAISTIRRATPTSANASSSTTNMY